MSLSLTCTCGARLEIDAAFAGQTIHCPDCKRPLNTTPAPLKPTRTSGHALASLLLALVGAFTIVGTLAAIGCGFVALNRIGRTTPPLGGKRFAQTGIGLGALFTVVTLVALWSPDILRLDGFLRSIEWAGKIEYPGADWVSIGRSEDSRPSIKRPGPAWGQLLFRRPDTPIELSDDLVLANLWDDAYIVCLTKFLSDAGQTLDACREEGEQRFLQSELVMRILGNGGADSPPPAGQDRERKQLPGTQAQEFLFDMRLAGIKRTFLIRVLREGARLTIVAGGTRSSRFARLQPEIARALESYKP